MKTVIKYIAAFCLALFSVMISYTQENTKVHTQVTKSAFSQDFVWMTGVIVVLLLVIIVLPKKTKRTIVYLKDKNGNTKAVTRTVIRGRKVQPE